MDKVQFNNMNNEKLKNIKLNKKNSFLMKNNTLIFNEYQYTNSQNTLDKIKYFLKKNETFYNFLKYTISPIYFDNQLDLFIKKAVDIPNSVIVNLGSGNTSLHKKVINVDVVAYDNVDIVCSIDSLPFENESVDVIITSSVLEHLKDPNKAINEIYRVLKQGGIIYTDIPFIVGFHASPNDYNRWTKKGIENLHKKFTKVSLNISGGPASALLWIFQEFISILFSFGNKKLHSIIYIIIMTLTFPFKFLDIFLNKLPNADNISSGFIYIGEKDIAK